MASRPHAIPPTKCGAHGRSGNLCRRWAVPGAAVCTLHGGASPQARDKALTRSALATLLRGDPRHPWEVVIDHMHTLDAVARDARVVLREGDAVSVEQVDRIIESAKAALTAAKLVNDMRAYELLAADRQRNTELEGRIISEVVGRVLDALLTGLILPQDRAQRLRAWAFDAAQRVLAALEDGDGEARPEVPTPPLDGLAFVTVEETAPVPTPRRALGAATAQVYSTDAHPVADGRQPEADSTVLEDDSQTASRARPPAPAVEPLEAELVEEPATSQPPTPRRTWSPSGLPSAWRTSTSPFSRVIG